MKATTILWDCANVYKKTFRYALITWTIFLLGTGALAWIMHQSGPHPAYEEMIIGKNGWTGEYEGAYNDFDALIYLTMGFGIAMILFAPLFGGYFLTLYKADHHQKYGVNTLFFLYLSKIGLLLVLLEIIKVVIVLLSNYFLGETFFIEFTFIILLNSLFLLTVFMKIPPEEENSWRKLFLRCFLIMGVYSILSMVFTIIIVSALFPIYFIFAIIYLVVHKFISELSVFIFILMPLIITTIAAGYTLTHFYFSSIYVLYKRFVLKEKTKHSDRRVSPL